MDTFTTYNPTRLIQGRGTIAQLTELVPADAKILMTYGGGSIKRNGVYDQVKAALAGFNLVEFGGIEANPTFETCMEAVQVCREQGITFLLSVGGGSALDGTKFIAAAAKLPEDVDAWGLLTGDVPVTDALPLADVLTLPATGSEANDGAVISRKATQEKLAFGNQLLFPRFSILDPETTFSLPENQVRNGIADTFVHTVEQYVTYPQNAPLQDRQAEGILLTLIENAPAIMQMDPPDYDARAILMDSATWALNTTLGRGVVPDWATHMIGHEITALYGVAHGETLSIIWPSTVQYKRNVKHDKLVQYARRVWGIEEADEDVMIDQAIAATKAFFQSIGMPVSLAERGIDGEEAAQQVQARFEAHDYTCGEHGHIGPADAAAILRGCA